MSRPLLSRTTPATLLSVFGVFAALSITAASAAAQLTQIGNEQRIHRRLLLSGGGDLQAADVVLQWSCPAGAVDTTLRAGTVVTRTATLPDGKTVSYQETLAAPVVTSRPSPLPEQFPSFRGTLHVDKTNPSQLRVNPYLWSKVPDAAQCNGQKLSTDSLRGMQFYYPLQNRQTVAFTQYSRALGPVLIPIRIRGSYTADNDARVQGGTASDLSAGVFFGGARAKVHYSYAQYEEPKIVERHRISLGVFATIAKITVDSNNTRASTTESTPKFTRSVGVPTASSGLALFYNVRGIDLGAFGGWEYALGRGAARRWDFNGRPWLGFGLAYQPPK